MKVFKKAGDYEAFERVLAAALEHVPGLRLLSYCLMPNHWHLVCWPRRDGELTDFAHYLTLTHTQRWHAHYHNVGSGHLYQGRFKSFPVASDGHYLQLCRYVERNALRAGLVQRAEDWQWGSLWRRQQQAVLGAPRLSAGPLPLGANWIDIVNEPQTEAELAALRKCVHRGQPYGEENWIERTARKFGLESTLRPLGRPRKPQEKAKKKGT